MAATVVINGRFLAAPATGVQRVALELTRGLDRLVSNGQGNGRIREFVLAVPANVRTQHLFSSIRLAESGPLEGWLWEQLVLPRIAFGKLLLNLCNIGPIAARNAVTMIHDAQPYSSPGSYSLAFRTSYKVIQPVLARRNRRVLTVSDFSKQELVSYRIAPAAKIEVIHNGVDHFGLVESDNNVTRRHSLHLRPFVLGPASVQPHKNVGVLLAAFQLPQLAEVDLVLYGAADAFALSTVLGRRLPNNVKPIGRVTDSELKGLMQSALCLAHPSLTEGFGLPPLEAMSVGCPVIVAPCGALPEVCGDAAIYANPRSAEKWADQITSLLKSRELWDQCRKVGLAHSGLYTWDRASAKLMLVLNRMLIQ